MASTTIRVTTAQVEALEISAGLFEPDAWRGLEDEETARQIREALDGTRLRLPADREALGAWWWWLVEQSNAADDRGRQYPAGHPERRWNRIDSDKIRRVADRVFAALHDRAPR